jgi:predicted transcriptional regulator
MNILESKGFLRHEKVGTKYRYRPIQERATAAKTALKQVIRTYFDGSIEKAVVTLVSESDANLSDDELERLARLIEQAKSEGG